MANAPLLTRQGLRKALAHAATGDDGSCGQNLTMTLNLPPIAQSGEQAMMEHKGRHKKPSLCR